MGAASIVVMCLLGSPFDGAKQVAERPKADGGFKPPSAPAPAQPERYDQIPIQGNIDAILKQLLLRADEDEELRNLFDQLRGNSDLAKLDPKVLAELRAQARNPWLRPELLELARRQQAGGLTPKDLQDLTDRFKQLMRDMRPGQGMGNLPAGAVPNPFLQDRDAQSQQPAADDRLARWTKDWLRDMDNSRAGDFLRDSPAWRNGLRNLDRWVKGSEGKLDWLRRMPEGWRLPGGWTPRLGEWTARLPNLPNLPRFRVNAPNLGRWNVNLGGGPALGAPSLGGASVNETIFWVLVVLVLALMAWLFYQKLGRAPALTEVARRRGPWPVDPAAVATRAQLIAAFDYLALLLLGDEARAWNHVAVAKKLAEQATRSPAAAALAQLYELARYTPGDDALSPDARAAARRHLVLLAGSAAA